MSGGQKSLLLWAAIILLVAYLAGINLADFVTGIIHAAQSVHQSSVNH